MATTYYHHTVRGYRPPNNSRYGGLIVVVVLHIVLAYLVLTLKDRIVEVLPQDIVAPKIEEVKPKEELPPPPPPKPVVQPPQVFVPPVIVNVQTPPPPNAIQNVTNKQPPPAPPVHATGTGDAAPTPQIDRSHMPDTQRYYPPIPKRLGEEGIVIMQVAVDPDGHVVDAKVEKSSGYARLDAAAVELSLKALRYLPFKSDKPVWTQYQVNFKQL